MAIVKKLLSSYGIEASYHKINSISINYSKRIVVISVSTYISKELRIKNCDPIDSVDIEIPDEDFNNFMNSNILEAAYNWLKVNVQGFEDSVDDLDVCSNLVVEENKYGEKQS